VYPEMLLDDNPWWDVVFFIQKYLTCEGRYSLIYLYHVCLLLHLKDKTKIINMPFYLLKSLMKMAAVVWKNPPHKEIFLYHHALIKLIVLDKLEKLNQTWDEFISRNQFQEAELSNEDSEKEEPILVNPKSVITGKRNKQKQKNEGLQPKVQRK
jgi:hypothetical protein